MFPECEPPLASHVQFKIAENNDKVCTGQLKCQSCLCHHSMRPATLAATAQGTGYRSDFTAPGRNPSISSLSGCCIRRAVVTSPNLLLYRPSCDRSSPSPWLSIHSFGPGHSMISSLSHLPLPPAKPQPPIGYLK